MKKIALFFAALLMTPTLFATTEGTTTAIDLVPRAAQRLFEEGTRLQDKRVDITVMKVALTLVYEASRINENVVCYRFAKEKMSYSDQAQMGVLQGMGIGHLNMDSYYCQAYVDLTLRTGREQ